MEQHLSKPVAGNGQELYMITSPAVITVEYKRWGLIKQVQTNKLWLKVDGIFHGTKF